MTDQQRHALSSWRSLNEYIRTADEQSCRELFEFELSTLKRRKFVQRIHSRLNRVRAAHERETIDELVNVA